MTNEVKHTELPPQCRRLQSYYYSFESTKSDAINAILEALAIAGKGFHHTENWNDKNSLGYSPIDNIQITAISAANEHYQLVEDRKKLLEMVKELLKYLQVAAYGHPENAKGSANAERKAIKLLKQIGS